MNQEVDPFGNTERMMCLKQLAVLIENTPEIEGALVSTIDGFDIAAQLPPTISASKLSAMASSQLALAEALCAETRVNTCKNIVIEAGQGNILVMDIPNRRQRLLLTAISGSDTTLGKLLWNLHECADAIGERLNASVRSAFALEAGGAG
ncbi:MAG: roadblock/LC7 domain-containing protein [Xanthomonadales bacterium]|nr:roadblock/LC7 domain-containing protein [Xanthomonadales bacterium]